LPSLASGSLAEHCHVVGVGLERIVLIFMAGQRLTMNVQARACDGLLALYTPQHIWTVVRAVIGMTARTAAEE